MLIPYLKDWTIVTKAGELLAPHLAGVSLDGVQKKIMTSIIEGGCDLDDLGRTFSKAWQADPQRVRASVLGFLNGIKCTDLADLDLPDSVAAIIIDRGWGGVYQHAIDLWRTLNRSHRALLIAPIDPMYGFPSELSRFLITPERLGLQNLSLVSTLSLARTILKKVPFDLLMFTHRAMTPYFFDIIREHPTIIYGDSHAEACLRIGEYCSAGSRNGEIADVLQELYFGTPPAWQSLLCSKALYWSFKYAAENWFWNEEQYEAVREKFPQFAERFHIVIPPIDTDRLAPGTDKGGTKTWILFTTSSEASAVPAKGLTPLLKVLARIPTAKLRVALRDERCAPNELNALGNRGEVLFGVAKEQMLAIYRDSVVNCRISRDDSSPVSVLESMSCGVPVIVSARIANHIPAIVDGVTGFVVEPDDLDRLEEKLNFLLNNPQARDTMGAEARSAVLRYSLSSKMNRITRYFRVSANSNLIPGN